MVLVLPKNDAVTWIVPSLQWKNQYAEKWQMQ
jgi:hypothetical protein